ncbi:AAA family ATPase [Flavobacterium chungnamense]|uniref:Endonuclease GajA/Old nuclease/RecF-like AAA domain-containing protein n=1 Tax=Flavobacterium chungnamense TaxID=706182 RepID=A0ABP7UUN2_9FLAO
MIKKIGVKNFRVFKDYTEFEIRLITILTGPNNSGKSSFSKLLLLLKNGIEELVFC